MDTTLFDFIFFEIIFFLLRREKKRMNVGAFLKCCQFLCASEREKVHWIFLFHLRSVLHYGLRDFRCGCSGSDVNGLGSIGSLLLGLYALSIVKSLLTLLI